MNLECAIQAQERYADVVETHSGVVFFIGNRAFKLKKRVDLGFLDFTRRETREALCRREVELNKRLAPDVYLGVAELIGPGGEVEDHLVFMRRLPDERRLSRLLSNGNPDASGQLALIARQLVGFHARALTGAAIAKEATRDAMWARWEANAAGIDTLRTSALDREDVTAVRRLAGRYLAGRGALFDARIAAGKARDGHGDLLTDDIFCLPDGPRILDCIEFDDRLRYGDVLSDVAFLAMDLERLGHSLLAREFLDIYRQLSGDVWPASLEHHHIGYRSFVRAKVAALRAEQQGTSCQCLARQLLDITLSHLDAGRVRLVVVGGAPGTGKSTLAAAVAERMGAALLSSDETRKQQAGLDICAVAAASFQEGLYRPEVTDATYRRLIDQARLCLARGVSVVIDASFTAAFARQQVAQLAGETLSDLDQLQCHAPLEVIEDRIRHRMLAAPTPSDATFEIAAAMASRDRAWPAALEVDTSGPMQRVQADVFRRLGLVESR